MFLKFFLIVFQTKEMQKSAGGEDEGGGGEVAQKIKSADSAFANHQTAFINDEMTETIIPINRQVNAIFIHPGLLVENSTSFDRQDPLPDQNQSSSSPKKVSSFRPKN